MSYPYWIGRFPITNAPFDLFARASGNERRSWGYGEPFDLPNHPVVGVTWYECLAFSRWLTDEWREKHGLSGDWAFRLPTEPEWEKAARGGIEIPGNNPIRNASQVALLMSPGDLADCEPFANPNRTRTYPWGHSPTEDALSSELLNYGETQIGSTNAVGVFPRGKSVYGCEEMSGGVWEWTRNKFADYEYNPTDGREEIDEKMDSRVFRGGSFASRVSVRCASRYWFAPGYRVDFIGFRLCLSPISSL
ncbi:MAG: SUMF1/EgtB/PvdO family nonheme iron enzyme [Planctomycetota bacterium]|nr:SUMF1/EgtB/PvdO family nonheme iron enzyme [Planctomycetota bacterium]MDA1143095.1 SUMF1/EgtB/PvdO family nonheme iron enzyme [Planctomycetota bacterium]